MSEGVEVVSLDARMAELEQVLGTLPVPDPNPNPNPDPDPNPNPTHYQVLGTLPVPDAKKAEQPAKAAA